LLTQRLQQPLDGICLAEQIELAWRYAYRFFFEYPFAFPGIALWSDMAAQPLEHWPPELPRVPAHPRALAGEPVDWRVETLAQAATA
jgi:hypothetical protein